MVSESFEVGRCFHVGETGWRDSIVSRWDVAHGGDFLADFCRRKVPARSSFGGLPTLEVKGLHALQQVFIETELCRGQLKEIA